MGGASIPYLLGTEIPNAAVREKTQSLGASWNVLWAFATNYSIPYIIDNIHFKVGWVFGSISILALVYTFFFLPETKVIPAALFSPFPALFTFLSILTTATNLRALLRPCYIRVVLSRKLMLYLMLLTIPSVPPKSITPTPSAVLVSLKARKTGPPICILPVTLAIPIRRGMLGCKEEDGVEISRADITALRIYRGSVVTFDWSSCQHKSSNTCPYTNTENDLLALLGLYIGTFCVVGCRTLGNDFQGLF